MKSGIFVVAEVDGPARQRIADIQRWADPKLANLSPPHVTLAGSSGVGPMPADTDVDEIRTRVVPIAASTPPITVRFERPHRFMQTDIIVLPIDPHGPLRTLHERLATSGLTFERPRFAFSPHCTLSFFQTMTPEMARRLLSERVDEPVLIERIQFQLTLDPAPPRVVWEVTLTGSSG